MFKPVRDAAGMPEELTEWAKEAARLRGLPSEQDDDLGYDAEFEENEDDEGPVESLLRHAPAIEAGLMPGWKLDRSEAGALLWTTPSGRQYRSTLDGSSYAPYQH